MEQKCARHAPGAITAVLLSMSAAGAVSCGGSEDVAPVPIEPLAMTPPMGFNDWNAFGCDVSETIIKETADFFVSSGLKDLDAHTWAEWGIDYLKYDNCYSQSDGSREDYVRRYTAMREAIDKAGGDIVYSICEWGQSQPWEWAAGVGHLWRTTGDISDNWSSLRSIIAANVRLAEYAGPGHWNDPDMLEIGNGGMGHRRGGA